MIVFALIISIIALLTAGGCHIRERYIYTYDMTKDEFIYHVLARGATTEDLKRYKLEWERLFRE